MNALVKSFKPRFQYILSRKNEISSNEYIRELLKLHEDFPDEYGPVRATAAAFKQIGSYEDAYELYQQAYDILSDKDKDVAVVHEMVSVLSSLIAIARHFEDKNAEKICTEKRAQRQEQLEKMVKDKRNNLREKYPWAYLPDDHEQLLGSYDVVTQEKFMKQFYPELKTIGFDEMNLDKRKKLISDCIHPFLPSKEFLKCKIEGLQEEDMSPSMNKFLSWNYLQLQKAPPHGLVFDAFDLKPINGPVVDCLPDPAVFNRKWVRYFSNKGGACNRLEIWTDEYVTALAEEIIAYAPSCKSIHQFGSNNGLLAFLLQHKLKAKGIESIVVTSSHEAPKTDVFGCVKQQRQDALLKLKPNLVICCWMPACEDWSNDLRAIRSVKGYILIGMPYYNQCGWSWDSWGVEPLKPIIGESGERQSPSYVRDGFKKTILRASQWQLSRADNPEKEHWNNSMTVYFDEEI